jgi:hypothetical protein
MRLTAAKTPLDSMFPNIEDLVIKSRKFDMFEDAIGSANKFVSELARTLNVSANQDLYVVASEINPRVSNKKTVSTDWAANEIVKFWIYDKVKQQETPEFVHAISLTQLIEVPIDPVFLT